MPIIYVLSRKKNKTKKKKKKKNTFFLFENFHFLGEIFYIFEQACFRNVLMTRTNHGPKVVLAIGVRLVPLWITKR